MNAIRLGKRLFSTQYPGPFSCAIIGNDCTAFATALILSRSMAFPKIAVIAPTTHDFLSKQILSECTINMLNTVLPCTPFLYRLNQIHLIEESGPSEVIDNCGDKQNPELPSWLTQCINTVSEGCNGKCPIDGVNGLGLLQNQRYSLDVTAYSSSLKQEMRKDNNITLIENANIESISIDTPKVIVNNNAIECQGIIDTYKQGTEYRRPHKLNTLIQSPNSYIHSCLASLVEDAPEAYYKFSKLNSAFLIPYQVKKAYVSIENKDEIKNKQDLIIAVNQCFQKPPKSVNIMNNLQRTYPPIIENPLSEIHTTRSSNVLSNQLVYGKYILAGEAAHSIERSVAINMNMSGIANLCNTLIKSKWDENELKSSYEKCNVALANGYFRLNSLLTGIEKCECTSFSFVRNAMKSICGTSSAPQLVWNMLFNLKYYYPGKYEWVNKNN
jgi:hypothetical protein